MLIHTIVCNIVYTTYYSTVYSERRYSVCASLLLNQIPPSLKTINTSTTTFNHKLNNDIEFRYLNREFHHNSVSKRKIDNSL